MSSLDRAFHRAYAKDQPAKQRAASDDNATPYVHFESQQQPQLRYRLEPPHAVAGGAAPAAHVDTRSLEVPAYDLYELESHEILSPRAERSLPIEPPHGSEPLPLPVEVPAKREPLVAPEPSVESLYCASVLNAASATTLLHLVCAETVVANNLSHLEAWEFAASGAAPDLQAPIAKPEISPPETATEQQEVAAAAEKTETSETFAPAPTAFWEVDHFLYPEMSDRLLQEYSYFNQAGEKLRQAAAGGLKVLAITGVGRGEGRTTLALCLARAAAKTGLRVGLIDCDFQRPLLAETLGLEISSGWQATALHGQSLAESAIRSLEDGIVLLPLVAEEEVATLQLTDARVAATIAQLSASLDVVILDAGPLEPAALAPGKKLCCDAAVVVCDLRHRTLAEAEAIARHLSAAGVEAVGIAENFTQA